MIEKSRMTAGTRVLYCRPRGGMNDVFCRIAMCINHARTFNRRVIIDTSLSGIFGHFDEFFELNVPGVEVDLRPHLQQLGGIQKFEGPRSHPHVLSFTEFLTLPRVEREDYLARHGIENPDLKIDHDEDFLYYEKAGGGSRAGDLLPFVTIRPEIRDWISDRSRILRPGYLSAHVRATDWMDIHVPAEHHRAAFVEFLSQVKRTAGPRKVYLATDHRGVTKIAKQIMGSPSVITLAPRKPLRGGVPRHLWSSYETGNERRAATKHALFDLFAISGSAQFLYPSYRMNDTDKTERMSGFARLARTLYSSPEVFSQFFGLPLPSVSAKSLLSRPTPPSHVATAVGEQEQVGLSAVTRQAIPVVIRSAFWERSIKGGAPAPVARTTPPAQTDPPSGIHLPGSCARPSEAPGSGSQRAGHDGKRRPAGSAQDPLGRVSPMQKFIAVPRGRGAAWVYALARRMFNVPRTLTLPPVVIISPGGVATTELMRHIRKYRLTNSVSDLDGLKHLPRPPKGKSKILYIAGDPQAVRASIARRGWLRIQAAKLGSGRGAFDTGMAREQAFLRAVARQEKNFSRRSSRRVLVVRYDDLWRRKTDIAEHLEITDPRFHEEFPARRSRQSDGAAESDTAD